MSNADDISELFMERLIDGTPRWMKDARCASVSNFLSASEDEQKLICESCPVFRECEDHTAELQQTMKLFGTWAGIPLNTQERLDE